MVIDLFAFLHEYKDDKSGLSKSITIYEITLNLKNLCVVRRIIVCNKMNVTLAITLLKEKVDLKKIGDCCQVLINKYDIEEAVGAYQF